MIITNARLVENGVITPCSILIQNKKIAGIFPSSYKFPAECEMFDAGGNFVSHGFIDIHVHGGGGYDFMDGTYESWINILNVHLVHGTTGIVPTTLAASFENLLQALSVCVESKNELEEAGSRIYGIHIEGPYVSSKQAGALDKEFMRLPDKNEYRHILEYCSDIIRWTIAPELPGSLEMADYLCNKGILPSIGHSDATADEVRQAIVHGFRHVTHLYSAMSTITRKNGYRFAGVTECAYLLGSLSTEIIADGRHLPPDLLQLVYSLIGPSRVCLITDAMRAAGENEKESVLGSRENGQKVIIEDGVAKLPDRSAFAGSVSTMDHLVRTMLKSTNATLPDVIAMVTSTPAKILGIENETGTVIPGRKADLVIFDGEVNIKAVITDGKLRYKEETPNA